MVPTGDLFLLGLHGESVYLKGLLDKINCQADMEHIGEYKSASETLTRTAPSPEAAEMSNWLFDSLYEEIVKGIAASRQMTEERVREVIDIGAFTAESGLEAKLIDAVEHRQAFLRDVTERYGPTAKIVKHYGRDKGPEIDTSSPFGFFSFFNELMQGVQPSFKPAVAVVYAEGLIIPGRSQESLFGGNVMGSTTLRAALDKARKDDSIKAVVLRIDSPGGSATASEIIYDAGRRVAEDKPFIVSMGNVAGSGGYYIAAGAHTIFAEPMTITGSIGVVGGKVVTKGLWDKLGVTSSEYNRGANADMLASNRPFTDAQRQRIRDWMSSIYATFTERVTTGRGDRLAEPIEKIARGRVFTGAQAVRNGLVDKLGGLDDAIRFAAGEAKIGDYDVRVLPKPKTFIDLLMEGFGMGGGDDDEVSTKLQPLGSASPLLQNLWPLLRQADPQRAAALARMLLRIELLRSGPGGAVLTVMPGELLIR
jgi:protease-4